MSRTTKIALFVAVFGIAAFVIIRRKRGTAAISDLATGQLTASHTLGAASTGAYGSTAMPAALAQTYGSLAQLVQGGDISAATAAQAFDDAQSAPPKQTQWNNPSLPKSAPAPASGPSTESRSGRGHF